MSQCTRRETGKERESLSLWCQWFHPSWWFRCIFWLRLFTGESWLSDIFLSRSSYISESGVNEPCSHPASLFECKERLLPQLFEVISFQGSPCGVFKCSFSAQDTRNVRQRNSMMLVRCVMSDGRNLWPSANTLFTLVHPKSLMKTHIFQWEHRYSWFY